MSAETEKDLTDAEADEKLTKVIEISRKQQIKQDRN